MGGLELEYVGKTNKEMLTIIAQKLEINNRKTERLEVILTGVDGDNGMRSVQSCHSARLDKLEKWRVWLAGGTMFALGLIGLLSKLGVL